MTDPCRRRARVRTLWLAVALVTASGCTLFGDRFDPKQPEGKVTLTGTLGADPISLATPGCTPGNTVFWGIATNTGDVPVTDVEITILVFDGAGGSLGAYSGQVFNGTIDDTNPDNPLAGTSLDVDQSGSFKVCTPVRFGAAARTDYRTSFIIVDVAE